MPAELFHLTSEAALLAAAVALLVGLAKSGIPGIGILMVPLMASLFPAGKSTGILLPMLVIGDIGAVLYYRRHAVWLHVIRALPWAVLGILAGFATIKYAHLSDTHLRYVIGALVLGILAMGGWINKKREAGNFDVPHTWWFAAVIGILGGFATMTANAAGPIWMIYLLALQLPKDSFLGTSGWVFLILNTFKLPFSYNLGFISAESLLFNAKCIPAIIAGSVGGIVIAKHIPQAKFILLVKVLTAIAAARLLLG